MKIRELPLTDELLDHYESKGIEELYPPQQGAVEAGVTRGENIVAAVPTASGKTLIAQLGMLSSPQSTNLGSSETSESSDPSETDSGEFSETDSKESSDSPDYGCSLYIVPLRALASEKYDEFSELPGVDVGISTGDYDSRDEYLGENDIIVATSEKVDSLIRNGVSWIKDLSCIVVDEVHLLDSGDRGPTLEVTLAKLRKLNPELQVIALSATIANPDDIAGWLDASLLESKWRPVDLRKGIYEDGEIEFENGDLRKIDEKREATPSLVRDSVEDGGQCLVFVNSRRNTQALAKRLADEAFVELPERGREIESSAETETGETLADCVSKGVAFHHAGLRSDHRSTVEEAFRNREIKVICATPTLAAGVNVPARRVIVRDHQRYSDMGMQPIPVLEIHQMFGRAGRPHLDPYGEAVLVAKNEQEKEDLWERYLESEPEKVFSKLASRQALRTHILSTVASGFADSRDAVLDFLSESFYAYQEDNASLSNVVDDVLRYLKSVDMVEEVGSEEGSGEDTEKLEATDLGHQVSRLYIDPKTGARIVDTLEEPPEKITPITFLETVCHTPDMYPFYLRKGEDEEMYDYAFEHEDEFANPPSEFDRGFEDWLSSLKTVRVIEEWISERDEEDIAEKYGVGPGDIHSKVEHSDWLLYAFESLANLLDSDMVEEVRETRKRVSHGVGEELLELVSVEEIGRVRARRLHEAGIRNKNDLRNANPERVGRLLGPKTAEKAMKDAGADEETVEEIDGSNVEVDESETKQSSIGDF